MKFLPAVAALVLVGGCTTVPAPVATVTTTASAVATSPAASATEADTVEPSETPTPATNERGNTPKKLGEEAVLVDGNGAVAARFTVTRIEPGFKCNSGYADKSENGWYVAVWMKIETTKLVNFDSDDSNVVPYFNPGDWQVVSNEGTTENDSEGNGFSCAKDSQRLPSQLKGGKKVTGVVVIDTKYKHGHLAMIQDYMDSGWEWDF